MTPKRLPAEREIVRDAATFCGPIVVGIVEYGKVSFWHDPAHVLVGILADRQPKPFGAF